MSNMQNRLEELQPYVIGVRFFQGLPVVDVVFKDKWVVPESQLIKKEKGEGEENYYYFYSEREGMGIDALLDHAENIINLNIEKEKKNELFKVKINELKKLFQNTTLSKLENMKFILGSLPITTEFNPDEINLDDEIVENDVIDAPVEQPREEPVMELANETNNRVINNTVIELPPKPTNGKGDKIELEVHELPPEALEGPCTHPADQFCPKCMDGM